MSAAIQNWNNADKINKIYNDFTPLSEAIIRAGHNLFNSIIAMPSEKRSWPPNDNGRKIIKEFIHRGAGVNILNKDTTTPLQIASYYGHLEIMLELLENGADVNATTKDAFSLSERSRNRIVSGVDQKGYRFTALHFVCMNDGLFFPLRTIELLIQNGAKINAQDKFGNTPLHVLIFYPGDRSPFPPSVSLLLDAGADMNLQNNEGITPLMKACKFNLPDIALILIEKGSNLNVLSKSGKTALDYCYNESFFSLQIKDRLTDVVKIIKENGGMTGKEVKSGKVSVTNPLFTSGVVGSKHGGKYRKSRKSKKKTRSQRRRSMRKRQRGGYSSVDIPGGIVIEKDADDEYSPFLAADRDTARAELSEASERE